MSGASIFYSGKYSSSISSSINEKPPISSYFSSLISSSISYCVFTVVLLGLLTVDFLILENVKRNEEFLFPRL